MILEGNSKANLIRAFGNITVGDIVGKGYPALSGLRKLHGTQKVEQAVAVLIVDASSHFERSINKEDALDLAAEITTCYYYLTLEDVMCALQKLKRSKVFGRLTTHRVLQGLEEHNQERTDIAIQKSQNEHLANKESRLNYDKTGADKVRNEELFNQFLDTFNEQKRPDPDQLDQDFETWKNQQE